MLFDYCGRIYSILLQTVFSVLDRKAMAVPGRSWIGKVILADSVACMIAINIDLNAGLLILTTYVIMSFCHLIWLHNYVCLFLLCDK